MTPRKVTHLAATNDAVNDGESIYAACEDGSVWVLWIANTSRNPPPGWVQLPSIPPAAP